ncbi:MAG: phosphoribosylformylglycinamidine cyclo-ligase [Candidatus Omnitrophica bacterium]|nr:phosphoribosylformylglycinamidine cyclo-ligase [Candidatus Omnitrophota bacterium]
MSRYTYKKSGVDVTASGRFIAKITSDVKSTKVTGALGGIGGFGALFDGRFPQYRYPVLVSSTDGVGTKLKIAQKLDCHDTVGIDLVAMNVNDILCVGAKPLFFLDYIACGKLQANVLTKVVKGIADGCRQAGCALIGGETAEMPGMYDPDEYDLAGFTVGVVEKAKLIDGSKIRPGDRLIGLASSGLHSNGFSLARKALGEKQTYRWGRELLKPTKIYVKSVLALLNKVSARGIAHITGGSFQEKLGRILPKGTSAHLDRDSWKVPEIFRKIQASGVSESEMYRTFNMGIGMILVVSSAQVLQTRRILSRFGIENWGIGQIEKGNRSVHIM